MKPRVRVQLNCGESKTHQSYLKECDINNIMAKYKKTGFFYDPSKKLTPRKPMFGDFSGVGDFAGVLNRINQINNDFLRLPAATRAKFDNDPSVMLDFIAKPENLKEAVSLELLPKELLPVDPNAIKEGQPVPTERPAAAQQAQ